MQSDLIIEQQTMIQNLKDYIQQNAGSLSEFAKTHNLYLSNLSNVLNGKRKFSTKLARELEDKLKLETGYFTKSKENQSFLDYNAPKQFLSQTYYGFGRANFKSTNTISYVATTCEMPDTTTSVTITK